MKTKSHSISGAFVFMLLGVFAVFSMLLVVLGAQAYRTTVDGAASTCTGTLNEEMALESSMKFPVSP